LDKKQLSESDICDKFIRPAMEQAGWHGLDQIYREFPLRAGRVSVRGNKAHIPIAVAPWPQGTVYYMGN
jgi:type I restriction enzyme R subunit